MKPVRSDLRWGRGAWDATVGGARAPVPPASRGAAIEVHAEATRALARFRNQVPRAVREELAQEVVLRFLLAGAILRARAFAHVVAHRLAIDHLRRSRTAPWVDVPDPAPTVEVRIDAHRAAALVDHAPSTLRGTLRALLLEGLEVDELVGRHVAGGAESAAGRRYRDLTYKRRSRGCAWLRRRLAA